MKYLRKIGKYIIYIEYLTYSICLINIIFIIFFNEYMPSFFTNCYTIVKKKIKMKIKKMLYYLSEHVHEIFSTLFFLNLLVMGIFYCLDIKINMLFRDLFFLLFGLWAGSATALSATSYMKKIYREGLGKKQNSKDS